MCVRAKKLAKILGIPYVSIPVASETRLYPGSGLGAISKASP